MGMFVTGTTYRRQALHDRFGGQRQGGISTPKEHPFILLFTSPRGREYGYEDGWSPDGVYLYTGEGQRGNMSFAGGNGAVRDHQHDGKDLHLFEATSQKGRVRYVEQMVCIGYHQRPGPDSTGRQRQQIVFELVPLRGLTTEPPEPAAEEALWRESLADLRRRALATASNPTLIQRQTEIYNRSQAIRVYALKRANGTCEGCQKPAPFRTPSGMPYLEVHHIRRLSDGGPDDPRQVISLCPNCHQRAHHAEDKEAFKGVLTQITSKKESQLPP